MNDPFPASVRTVLVRPRRQCRVIGVAVLAVIFACIDGLGGHVALAQQAPGVTASGDASADPPPPAAADEPRFDIWEYRVLGNTLLEPRAIEQVVYPLLGPGRALADVQKARESLEAQYRERGYGTVFVDIPEQDTADGIVRLQVTEGRLDRVRISGARYFANGRIRAAMTALQPGSPPSLPAVQAQLAEVNAQNPDRRVTPILRAGRTPGTVDVELKVEDVLPLHGSVEVTDRFSADTSRLRASASLSYGDLFQRNHSLSLQYQLSPEEPSETRAIAATYVMPLAPSQLLAVYAVDTKSDVAALGTLSVLGNGRIFGARYIRLLPAGDSFFHNLTLGFDFKDFAESIRLDSTGEPIDTPIKYGAWSAVYAGGQRAESWRTTFNLGAFFGLRRVLNDPYEFSGNPNDPLDPQGKRFLAKPNYFYLRAGGTMERSLPWGFTVAARVAGQGTTGPLISNEQFAIGGVDSVRGYLESDQLGDIGFNGSLELRLPSMVPWFGERATDAYAYVFYDAGIVALIDPLPGQVDQFDLSSAGAGLRFRGLGGLEATLDWAYPLVPSSRVLDGDSRLHFSVKYGF